VIEHARRGLPWLLLGLCVCLGWLLIAAVARWPYELWPLQGTAVGLLAAASAWCVDEPAGAVVDATPRHLWWRTTARAVGVAALSAGWLIGVALAGDDLLDHPSDIAFQGLAAQVGAVGLASWLRAGGLPSPGRLIAASVVPVCTVWALLRPFEDQFPAFPYVETSHWATSRLLWLACAVVGSGLLYAALSDLRWRGRAQTEARSASTRSVRSQVNPGSSRPKWP
jgi:hypothetical protein